MSEPAASLGADGFQRNDPQPGPVQVGRLGGDSPTKRVRAPVEQRSNRGDWLYAAACRFFGSWGKAVEAAGIRYPSVKRADLDRSELLSRIRNAAEAGPLLATKHTLLSANALRLFGSWKKAVKAAGCAGALPQPLWNKARVIEQIKADLANGLPVNTLAVIARNQPLYGAARREFGSWVKALRAVDPKLVKPRWKRGESIIASK